MVLTGLTFHIEGWWPSTRLKLLATLPSENRSISLVRSFCLREFSLNPLTVSVEMLLLLIWRHIDHYSNPPAKEEPAAGTPVSPTPPKGAWGGLFSPWKSTANSAAPLSKGAWATSAGSHNQQQSWLAVQGFRRDIKGALKPVLDYLDGLQLVSAQPSSAITRLLTFNLEPDDVPGLDARARTAYLKAFHRRIRDTVADPTEEGDPDDEMMLVRD